MRLNKITFEIVLFVLAGLAALAIRFLFLGSIPLNDNEANLALQALALSKGESVILSGHPAYLVLTSFFMSVFGATEFTARFWPALAGVVMVGAAWLLRDALGRNNALVLAFALALDPILVASSRNAGSAALAIVFVAGGFVFALLSRSLVTGIFLGLALLSGPQFWPGAVGLFLMGLVLRKSMGEDEARPQINWRTLLIAAGMTLALGSTFFFLYPGGFTGIGGGLADYLSGWGKPSGVPPTRLLAVLIYYELPLVVLAIINLIRGLRAGDRMAQAMGVWWAAALLLALIYPGRDVYSLVWSALPMLLLAVRQIVDLKFSSKDGQLVVIGQAALTIVLLFFMVYRLINLPLGVEGTPVPADILLSIGIGMVLLVAVTVAIGYGWTWAGAARGLILGSLFWAGVLWISASVHAAGVSRLPENEMLASGSQVKSSRLLNDTIKQYGDWRPNSTTAPSIAVVGLSNPSIVWALRAQENVVVTDFIAQGAQPEIILTPLEGGLDLSAAYRGQEWVWSSQPAWDLVNPSEWLRWLFFRELSPVSVESRRIVFWLRSDVFPGGGASLPETLQTEPLPAETSPTE